MRTIKAAVAAAAFMVISCGSTTGSDPEYIPDPVPPPAAVVDVLLPFSRGVNFSTWFEASSPRTIPFTRFTEQDFRDAKSLGIDVIRLPINLHSMTITDSGHTLDPLFMGMLDQAIDWAEQYQMYIILDNHSFDPVVNTAPDIDTILIPVWTQLARRYANRSEYVLYEILNEPHGIDAALWADIQGRTVQAIREIDSTRRIIAGGVGYNSIDELFNLPEYNDDNIIYTFHFYDPYLFTHQGAAWGNPPNLATLQNLPFPADAHALPAIPPELRGTWVEDSVTYTYRQDSSISALAAKLDKAVQFSRERNVPLLCGEFGVYIPNTLNEDRVRWYQIVTTLLDDRKIARTSWDYFGGFGIFTTANGGLFSSDLNVDVVRALGFTPPPQKPAEKIRDGFSLFDHHPAPIVRRVDYWSCEIDLYRENAGKYAIGWSNADQYGHFSFSLKQEVDWAYLAAQNYAITFTARADQQARFDVRFIDDETGSNIPWRLNESVTIDGDGQWHTVRIPLASMWEQGAWVNATQESLIPEGKFSWERVAMLSFVAEKHDLHGISVEFDSIKLER